MAEDNAIEFASTGDVDWSVFLQEGVIVTLTIRRYRGVTTVDFSELGIDDSGDDKLRSFLEEYIQPGQKRLIPPEIEGQLKSIETTARNNLKERSFDCSAFASQGKFVPKSMYPEFKQANEELADRFYAIRDEFADNYDNIIAQVRKDYRVLAERIYMQSHPDAKRASSKYVTAFVDKIVEQIPSADEIVASFEYSTVLRRIPDYLLNAIRKKNNIDARVMRIAASNQPTLADRKAAEQQSRKKPPAKAEPASPERIPTRQIESVDDLIAPPPEIDEVEYTEEAPGQQAPAPEEHIDEIERDIRDSISDQSEGMMSEFVTDILIRLRTMAYDGSSSIVQSIDRNNGKLVGRASIKAHSLIDDLRKMNFYDDQELSDMVDQLEFALGPSKDNRDVSEVRRAALALREWAERSMGQIHDESVSYKAANMRRRSAASRGRGRAKAGAGDEVAAGRPDAGTQAKRPGTRRRKAVETSDDVVHVDDTPAEAKPKARPAKKTSRPAEQIEDRVPARQQVAKKASKPATELPEPPGMTIKVPKNPRGRRTIKQRNNGTRP